MGDREQERRRVLARLRRIEGQIRGLQRMIEEDQDCADIVTQLSAVRGALDKVGLMMLSHRLEECVRQKLESEGEDSTSLEEALKLFLKLT